MATGDRFKSAQVTGDSPTNVRAKQEVTGDIEETV